jgi:hypothetical protein
VQFGDGFVRQTRRLMQTINVLGDATNQAPVSPQVDEGDMATVGANLGAGTPQLPLLMESPAAFSDFGVGHKTAYVKVGGIKTGPHAVGTAEVGDPGLG